MKTLKTILLVIFLTATITSCREQTPQQEPPVQEVIEQDTLDVMVKSFEDTFDAELVDKHVSEFLVSYTFLLPVEMANINAIRVGAILAFNQFGYDITQVWFVDEDGKHFTSFTYKSATLKLEFDPSTNHFCIEITKI